MTESEIAERIAARRAELDNLEEQLAKQLAEVRPSATNSPSPNGSGTG
ncbi:hypothetical protein [Streptomyces sp. NPDC001415]